MVFRTVRSLGCSLMTFSYSAMALGSLHCWTYFSAALSAFALLKPNPSAISESLNRVPLNRRGEFEPGQFSLTYHRKTGWPKLPLEPAMCDCGVVPAGWRHLPQIPIYLQSGLIAVDLASI